MAREYIVGMDKLFGIEAESSEEAEAELARRISDGELDLQADECQTYEVVPDA